MQRYDVPTAVTFLFAGLGFGALVAIMLAPRPRSRKWRREPASERRFEEFEEGEAFVGPAV